MFKQMVAALCVAGAMACANQVQAAVLYDNFNHGGPATYATNIFNDRQANSFTLSSAAMVTGLNFQVWLELSNTTLKSFQWGIYDASPFSGGVLLGGATVQDPTQSGPLVNPYGVNERLVTLDLAPLSLAAGTYWLAIGQAAATIGRGYWEVSGGPSDVACSAGCAPGASNSFSILGSASVRETSIAVPEPATWAMLIMGFMGIGAMVRRQNHHRRFASAA